MIRLSVRHDYLRLERTLDDFQRRQLPFATARMLTATAKAAQAEGEHALPNSFDRPTPFTQRSLGVVPATKSALRAEVFVRDVQAKYLGLQERGGIRKPKKQALVNPAAIKLNQYGNIPNKALARLKQRRDVFVGTVKGVGGVWQRPDRGARRAGGYGTKGNTQKRQAGFRTGLTLLMRFAGPEQVKPHPWFAPAIRRVGQRDFRRLMQDALVEALRTARP